MTYESAPGSDDAQEYVPQSVRLDDVITTVVMARVTDYFGFFVFAIASALVFPKIFFPFLDPVPATLASFGIFALAFLARPVASLLGRKLEKRIGRAGKITVALMLLGTSTVAIGLLPGYDRLGWVAPALLAGFRIIQGLGLGGSWDGLTLQLKSAAPQDRTGLYGMVPQLGGPIGFCVAAAMFFVLTGFLTPEEFYQHGWRFAFFAVMAVNVVSLFARLRLLTTDFGSDGETLMKSAPFGFLVRTEWRTILLSAFLPLSSYALLHMLTVFPISYTLLFTDHAIDRIILWQLVGGALSVGTVILSGVLADRYTKRAVLLWSSVLTLLLCLTIGTLNDNPAIYIIPGFLIFGLSYGQSSAIVPNRFAPDCRYSGSALSTNLSWIFGAAFAPLVGLFLASRFGLWAAALYLVSGVLVTLATLYILQREFNQD
ncbi:MFS transporter [Pseudosulfitobacter sp. DSM 107133]|uniref:MFS transporter n=1 Tax=Pseudosulfitobacter sp. DSM 107133 TaxID=2883100 RepID=UPI000DF3AD87|nr:MFS transporter [Pseudosulfitobacter sp. DSM 107133]UOA30196.1 Inner membrane metabolite transport protein YhjE [Pseudosulfitobacter sp. DSM 107133]